MKLRIFSFIAASVLVVAACQATQDLGGPGEGADDPTPENPGAEVEDPELAFASDGGKSDGGKSDGEKSDAGKKDSGSPPADSGAPDATTDSGAATSVTIVRAPQSGSTLKWTTIWGSSSTDVYFGGSGGAVARWNGSSVTPVSSFTSKDIHLISGSGPNHVWADVRGTGFRFDGSSWSAHAFATSVAIDATTAMGFDMNKGTATDIRRSRFIVDGVPQAATTNLDGNSVDTHEHAGVWVVSKNDVWIAVHNVNLSSDYGDDLQHWNGTTWSLFSGFHQGWIRVYAMSGTSTNDVWAAGTSNVVSNPRCPARHWDGLSWTNTCPGLSSDGKKGFTGIYAAAPDKVWATGWEGLFFYDGATWSQVTLPASVASNTLYAVWGTGPNDVWVGGSQGLLLHLD